MMFVKRILWLALFFTTICHQASAGDFFNYLVDHLVDRIAQSNIALFIVGIGGCPGVGKSTLADQLATEFSSRSIKSTIFRIDDFNLPSVRRKSLGAWNFSHLYLDDLRKTLADIVSGETIIKKPIYSQKTGECGHEVLDLSSTRVLIFEGLYATCSREPLDFLKLCSASIFVVANEDLVWQWKKERNESREIPRSEQEFKVHMNDMLREYSANIEYSRKDASIVITKGASHEIVQLDLKKAEALERACVSSLTALVSFPNDGD